MATVCLACGLLDSCRRRGHGMDRTVQGGAHAGQAAHISITSWSGSHAPCLLLAEEGRLTWAALQAHRNPHPLPP